MRFTLSGIITLAVAVLLLCSTPCLAGEGGGGGGEGASADTSLTVIRDPITGEASFDESDPLELAEATLERIQREGADRESTMACRAVSR